MKWITFLAVIAVSALCANELVPELEPIVRARETELIELRARKPAALEQAKGPYLTALNAADQTASTAGKTDAIAAVTQEQERLQKNGVAGSFPNGLPKNLEPHRRVYLKACERVELDFAARAKAIDSNCLRKLAALQFKAAASPKLAAQLAAEKRKIAAGVFGPIGDLRTDLEGTFWRNRENKEDAWTFADGKLNATWRYEAPARDRVIITWHATASTTMSLEIEGRTLRDPNGHIWDLATSEKE